MSSNTFSANLIPEPCLRSVVVLVAQAQGFVGCLALLVLPVPAPLSALIAAMWLLVVAYQIRRLKRGQRRCRIIRVAASGHVEVQIGPGDWQPAVLKEGSMVLQKFAWLRLKTASSGEFAELMSQKGQDRDDWRRLSVIWRHIGAAE